MATELGKAYVQIVPSARGISGKIKSALGDGSGAGSAYGKSLVSGIKKMIVSAGIGTALYKTINEGAKLEQSLGGAEALFKDHAKKVIQNSEFAYMRAGMSQNEYLETVTSFSAALINDLGGDTAKAADIANEAAIQMSDNWNRFGGDFEMIRYAYQGFAKQNYKMLDNLKLGYGGTQTEMERLIKDANEYAKSIGEAGDLSMDSFADQVKAIGLIQEKLGIAGTTMEEAKTTISGSMAMLKASFKNLMGQLVIGDNVVFALRATFTSLGYVIANVGKAVMNVFSNLKLAFSSILPMLLNALNDNVDKIRGFGLKLTQAFIDKMFDIPNLLDKATTFLDEIIKFLDPSKLTIKDLGKNNGIIDALFKMLATDAKNRLPELANVAKEIMQQFLMSFEIALPRIVEAGKKLFEKIVELLGAVGDKVVEGIGFTLTEVIPTVINGLSTLIRDMGNYLSQNLPTVVEKAVEWLTDLGKYIIDSAPSILSAIGNLVSSIITFIAQSLPSILAGIGKVVTNIAKYLYDHKEQIFSAAKEMFYKIKDAIVTNLPNIVESIISLGIELVGALLQYGPKFFVAANKFMTEMLWGVITSIPSIVVALAQGAIQAIASWLGSVDWATAGLNAITYIAGGIVGAVGGVISAFGEIAADAIETLMNIDWVQVGADIVKSIASGIGSIGNIIPSSLGEAGQMAINFFKGEGWTKSGSESGSNLATGLLSQNNKIQNVGTSLANYGITGFSSKFSSSRTAGINLGNYAVTGVQSKWGASQSTGSTLGQRAVTGFGSLNSKMYSTGGGLGNKGVSGVQSWFGGAGSAGSGLGSNVNSGFGGLFGTIVGTGNHLGGGAVNGVQNGGSGAVGVGQYISLGVARGIDAGASAAISAAIRMATQALNAAKSRLDIRSPSRVFRDEVGKMVSLGFAKGIEETAYAPINATKTMVDDIVSEADTGMKAIADITAQDFSAQTSIDVNGGNTALNTVIQLLSELVGKDMSIYLDGEKVGEQLTPVINKKLGEVY